MSILNDLLFVARRWRVVHLLGVATLRARYARSRMGQVWLTLSTLVLILSTGAVWSLIWKMEIGDYLPYVGIGHVVYLFLSQSINESSGVFVADARLYLNERVPFFMSVAAHLYRNGLVLLHNIPIVVALVLWAKTAHPHISGLYGLVLLGVMPFLFAASYIIATLCTRFRDLTQIVALLMQIAMLLTPVMWKVEFIPEKYRPYVFINPFAAMLDALRNPLLGAEVNPFAYWSLLGWDVLLLALFVVVYRRWGRATIFWV